MGEAATTATEVGRGRKLNLATNVTPQFDLDAGNQGDLYGNQVQEDQQVQEENPYGRMNAYNTAGHAANLKGKVASECSCQNSWWGCSSRQMTLCKYAQQKLADSGYRCNEYYGTIKCYGSRLTR